MWAAISGRKTAPGAMMPDESLFTLTVRMGFTREDRLAIATWWTDSGQARWDKNAEATTPACYMEVDEFIRECVRGNLAVLRAEMKAKTEAPKKKLRVRVRRTS